MHPNVFVKIIFISFWVFQFYMHKPNCVLKNTFYLMPEVAIRLFSFCLHLYNSFHSFSPDVRSGYMAHFICFHPTPEVAIQLILSVFTWCPKWLYSSFHMFSPDARSGYTAYFICLRLMHEVAIRLIFYVFAWRPKWLYGFFHLSSPDAQSGYTAHFIYFCLTPQVAIWLNSFIFAWHRWWW